MSKYIKTISLFVIILMLGFMSVYSSAFAYAEEYTTIEEEVPYDYETSSVISDLNDGVEVSESEFFPVKYLSNIFKDSLDSIVQGNFEFVQDIWVISFIENGYGTDNFGIYLYVYNPNNLDILTDSNKNKVQFAACNSETAVFSSEYVKYNVVLLDKTENNKYMKFKVDGFSALQSSERYYAVSGIELHINGDANATDYSVGSVYHCSTQNGQTTISRGNLGTINVDCTHVYYRTDDSNHNPSNGWSNQLSACYFSLPKAYSFGNNPYGALTEILAEFDLYYTKPILLLNNFSVYSAFGFAFSLSTSSSDFQNNPFINLNNLAFRVLFDEFYGDYFINERPIVFMVCGTMGKKKTTAITDMALSQEIMFRDKAFEKILENDLKFPFFPWINLENEIKRAMAKHEVYNLATCRKFVTKKARKWYKQKTRKNIFDYDYERYGLTYDDKLKLVDIWQVLETYAQLYFIYIIQSSLIISNFSVRTDSVLSDVGNFPMWDSDFFKRDSRLIDSFSRHAHILDFDSLRLGRKLLEDNPNKDGFEFGVILITEIGKERGNVLELADKLKKADTANQKNDLFNSWLKMIRHSGTVDNFPFVRVITDEQRPESWGVDARALCEIVSIKESGETRLSMPFFSLAELLYAFMFGKFTDLYYKYRFSRGDNTLFMYLLKKITSKINGYYVGIYNRFGYCALDVQIESGTQDGEIYEHKYYLSVKKIYSKRFSTDCFSDFFTEKALRSKVGIDDLKEYATEKASFDELQAQNSYFVNDLIKGFLNEKEE